MKTTGSIDGDEYVINGSKTLSPPGFRQLVIVVAKTDPAAPSGISLFLGGGRYAGLDKGKRSGEGGHEGPGHLELFAGRAVPKETLLGQAGIMAYLARQLPRAPDRGDWRAVVSRGGAAMDTHLRGGVWQG